MSHRTITNEEFDLVMRFHDAKSFFLHSAVKAVAIPALTVVFAFLQRSIVDKAFGDVFSPMVVQSIGYFLLGTAALWVVLFAPRTIRDVRDLLSLAAQLKSHGIRPIWFERPTVSGEVKRYFGHGAVALCLMVLGTFIDGGFGMLLRIAGVAGVVYIVLMLAITGDVVVGGGKDNDMDR